MSKPIAFFPKTFVTLMTVTFAVTILGIIYGAANSPTQLRSKASEDGHIYKSWEFDDDTSTGGWTGQGVGLTVFDGSLNIARLKNPKASPEISATFDTTLPPGKKLLQINLAVGANLNPTLGIEDDRSIPRASVLSGQAAQTFVIPVTYQIAGNLSWQKPLILTGKNDAKFASYSLSFEDSELAQLKISKLRLDLSRLNPTDFIKIDSIRLVGTYR